MSVPPVPSAKTVGKAVQEYNARYGPQATSLWKLGQLARQDPGLASAFVWAIKVIWNVQGVWKEDREPMAVALSKIAISMPTYRSEEEALANEHLPCKMWSQLVLEAKHLGVKNRPFSWASKALHFMFPEMIPVYDYNVRRFLGRPNAFGDTVYKEIVRWEYEAGRRLLPDRARIVGAFPPPSMLQALDKYIWWETGGKNSLASPLSI